MEPDHISVVLCRASQLHSNITAAISRTLHPSTPSIEFPFQQPPHALSLDSFHDALLPPASPDSAFHRAAEARSLVSIRDALEVLEEQLECLKTLQQQQRAEKDATLAELEESRGILIGRLKKHHGRELEVIKEAFSFVGEPFQEQDELPLPPYPMRLAASASSFANLDHPNPSCAGSLSVDNNFTEEQLVFADGEKETDQDTVKDEDGGKEDRHPWQDGSVCQDDVQKSSARNEGLFAGFRSRIFKIFKGRIGKVAAAFCLIVAGAATVSVLSDTAYGRHQNKGSGRRDMFLGGDMSTEMWQRPQMATSPPGQWSVLQDGMQQIEMPLKEKAHIPDISYGRG